ncbi:uncharacterized protein LOC117601888 isoform X2 [Osmia lignaria lignaria]|uniref:uncharacterized protein LOC117601888 isoform X2 n=1 Tax=Osmia lignaria lignaria TaxID=1437193 RepID=UPI00402B7AB1
MGKVQWPLIPRMLVNTERCRYIGQHRIKGTHCLVVTDVYTLYDVTTESHTAPGKVNGGKRKEKINSTLPMDGYEKRDRYLCIFLIAILRYQGNLISSYHFVLHVFLTSTGYVRIITSSWNLLPIKRCLDIAPMMKPEEDDASFGNEPKKSSVDATFIATMST